MDLKKIFSRAAVLKTVSAVLLVMGGSALAGTAVDAFNSGADPSTLHSVLGGSFLAGMGVIGLRGKPKSPSPE